MFRKGYKEMIYSDGSMIGYGTCKKQRFRCHARNPMVAATRSTATSITRFPLVSSLLRVNWQVFIQIPVIIHCIE